MSKKNILSEAVVRKFMKLAELENLSADFVSEQFKEEEVVEEATEEVVEEDSCTPGNRDKDLEDRHSMEEGPGMAYKANEDEEEAAEEEAEELPEEEPEAEEEMEMEEPEEEAEMSISPEEAEVLKSILQKLEAAMGEEAAEAPEMDAEPEMELDAEPEMEEEPMMEGDKEEKDDSLQEMVNTIAARVAKRILEQGK